MVLKFFSELVWSVIEGRLKGGAVGLFLASARDSMGNTALCGLSDTLWGIGIYLADALMLINYCSYGNSL